MKYTLIIFFFSIFSCSNHNNQNDLNSNIETYEEFIQRLPERIKLREVSEENEKIILRLYFNDEDNKYCIPLYSYILAYYFSESIDIMDKNEIEFQYYFTLSNSTENFIVTKSEIVRFKTEVVSHYDKFELIQYLFHSMTNKDIRFLNLYMNEIAGEKCLLEKYPGNIFDLIFEYGLICGNYDQKAEENLAVKYLHCLYELTLKPASRVDSKHLLFLLKNCDKYDITKQ